MIKRIAAAIGLIALSAAAILVVTRRPSSDRDWSPDQKVMPEAIVRGDRVTIRNVRNFEYRSVSDYVPRFEARTYDLRKLDSIWFVVERFPGKEGIAHTFLTYGFGQDYVAISVEIRKERGETYSPIRGLLREYELMYVIADERDVIGLRTNMRRDEVRLYPIRTSRERMRQVFLDMLARANKLRREPEFYNTLTNTCTTNIVRHVNTISPKRVPFSFRVLLPADSDSLAYDLGLIDTTLPLEAARRAYRIDETARRGGITPDFSRRIRAVLPGR